MSLQKFHLLVPRSGKEPSRRLHRIENWRWQEQNKQLKRMGVENNLIRSLLKWRKQQERQRPPLEGSKSHIDTDLALWPSEK